MVFSVYYHANNVQVRRLGKLDKVAQLQINQLDLLQNSQRPQACCRDQPSRCWERVVALIEPRHLHKHCSHESWAHNFQYIKTKKRKKTHQPAPEATNEYRLA